MVVPHYTDYICTTESFALNRTVAEPVCVAIPKKEETYAWEGHEVDVRQSMNRRERSRRRGDRHSAAKDHCEGRSDFSVLKRHGGTANGLERESVADVNVSQILTASKV